MATIDIHGASLSGADPPISTNPNPDLAIKAPVRAATTGSNITLSGLQTIDGVALAAGDRVLVKDQTDATTNGLYNASTGNWTRTIDANNNSQLTTETLVAVAAGSVNAATIWQITTAIPITLGTSNLTFSAVKGNVVAPASSTAGHAATFADATGKLLQDSKVAITSPATGSTLTIADGKVLTANNSLTLAGTDSTTITFQGTDTYVGRATTDALTNKTFDTGGAGNVLKLGGTQIASIGTGLAAASNALLIDASYMRGYLAGCTLSGGGSQTLTINAGVVCSDDFTVLMKLGSNYTKTFAAWAVGSGNGGLDTGAIGNNTWYHAFIIERTDTGVVDVLISLSATAPALPANYTKQRRIGSVKTDGTPNIIAFVQDGDYFRWKASVLDINSTNPGTTAQTATLTVPTGINVFAIFNAYHLSTTSAGGVYFSDLAANDEAASATAAPLTSVFAIGATGNITGTSDTQTIRTNTSAQIRWRSSTSDANTNLKAATLGWIDTRGRFV